MWLFLVHFCQKYNKRFGTPHPQKPKNGQKNQKITTYFLLFIHQEENTELREKMEDLEDKISIEQDRKKEAEEDLKNRNKLLVGIREGLDHLMQTVVSKLHSLHCNQARQHFCRENCYLKLLKLFL